MKCFVCDKKLNIIEERRICICGHYYCISHIFKYNHTCIDVSHINNFVKLKDNKNLKDRI